MRVSRIGSPNVTPVLIKKKQFQSRMRSILRLKRVCAEKHGFIRRYKASFAKSGIASLPDLRFDVLRIGGTLGLPP